MIVDLEILKMNFNFKITRYAKTECAGSMPDVTS